MSDMGRDLHLARSSSTFFKSGMWFNLIKSASLEETLIPKYLIFPDCSGVEEFWKEQLIGELLILTSLLNNLRLLRKSLLM